MWRYGILASVLILSVACGGSTSSPSGSSGGIGSSGSGGSGGSGSGKGTITALVDGVAYTGVINAATLTNGTLNIASNNTALTLSVNFAMSGAAVGTTSINAASPLVMQAMTTNGSTVTGAWSASVLGGSGTLTISTLSSSGASGTFSFVAVPSTTSGIPSAGTKTVTSGVFTATF
ncbi:MAG: hypothetical protein ABMA15_09840 [Vicinamibacterales bacterium]